MRKLNRINCKIQIKFYNKENLEKQKIPTNECQQLTN